VAIFAVQIYNMSFFRDKVVVVTGGSDGIGKALVELLLQNGAKVATCARNHDKLYQLRTSHAGTSLITYAMDVSNENECRRFIEDVAGNFGTIDILINNAGVMFPAKRELTKQNFEVQFGTNHLGHFLLTGLLLDILKNTPNSRIAIQSSGQHKAKMGKPDIHFDDLNFDKGYNKYVAYSQSKLANLLFAYELDRRLKANQIDMTVVAAHPGYTKTNLTRHTGFFVQAIITNILAQNVEMGTLPILRAATDTSVTGSEYFGPTKMNEMHGYPELVKSSNKSYDKELAEKLWKVSEQLTQIKYEFNGK